MRGQFLVFLGYAKSKITTHVRYKEIDFLPKLDSSKKVNDTKYRSL